MKILGICGSPRPENISTSYRVLRFVLESSGLDFEIIHLGSMKFSGCIACLRCTDDNVCKIADDLEPLRAKILEADGYVAISPNYYSGMTSLMRAFFERWFQFRHKGSDYNWGKLAIAIGVGSISGDAAAEEIEKMFAYNYIKVVDRVGFKGNPSCFYCGFGKVCEVGVPKMLGIECPPADQIPDVLNLSDNRQKAESAGKKLARALTEGYDKNLTIIEMQQILTEKFLESV